MQPISLQNIYLFFYVNTLFIVQKNIKIIYVKGTILLWKEYKCYYVMLLDFASHSLCDEYVVLPSCERNVETSFYFNKKVIWILHNFSIYEPYFPL